LTSVDLPTLGRPTSETNPDRKPLTYPRAAPRPRDGRPPPRPAPTPARLRAG
jgi:hypothetical protein